MTAYACRVRAPGDYEAVLDFGEVAPADSFLPSERDIAAEQRYPLTLVLCHRCLHVQIKEVLDPRLLFSEYVWETGIPASIQKYCQELADAVLQWVRPAMTSRPTVVEIASNDGTMLKELKSRGWEVVGVDP